jgi:hypothetical protein
MSLPSKQEVLKEAQNKGFSERVKFGARLGHKHAKTEGLSALLKDVRSYEEPIPPQLDAASVELSKVLPAQQKSGAKHFDVEQVVLAAATASGDRATLEAEIRGPSASHLVYASQRLCAMVGKDEAGSNYLFGMLIELADKRRKALLKALIKNRHVSVLDRYAAHLADEKDLYARLAGFLHGCSHAVVVKHVAALLEREKNSAFLHFARYHPMALLEVVESQLVAGKGIDMRTNQVWGLWRTYATRHGRNGQTVWCSSREACTRVLELASKYPPVYKYNDQYHPTMPDMILAQWSVFTKFHGDALFDFASKCTYPYYNFRVYTFGLDVVRKRDQMFRFLEACIPQTVNHNLDDPSQLTLPAIFHTAVGVGFGQLTYLPDVLEHMKKLADWAKRYSAKFPSLAKYHYWTSAKIFAGAARAIDRIRTALIDSKVEPRHLRAKEQLRLEGKSFKEMTPALLGCAQVDYSACDKAQEELYAQFLSDFESDVKLMHLYTPDDLNYTVRQRISGIMEFSREYSSNFLYSMKNARALLNLYEKYPWTVAEFNDQWLGHKKQIMTHIWTHVTNGQHSQNDHLYYTPAQIKRFTAISEEGWKMFYDIVAKNPNSQESRPYVALALESSDALPWKLVEPFWKFLTNEHFIEMAKDGQEQLIIDNFFKHVPIAAVQPVMTALFAPKVLTPSQRQILMPFLDVSDAKNRQAFEKGTSSSSAPERIAALVRFTHATASVPFADGNDAAYAAYMQDKAACEASLKESTATLAFVIKRIKNATFQDRVIYQRLAFVEEHFGTIWMAPGVGPTQYALWYEMLDDHLQNPNQSLTSIVFEDEASYSSALEQYDWSTYDCEPLHLWNIVISRAISLGLSRNDDALLDFGFEVAAKIGTVELGAADPLGNRIRYAPVAGRLVALRDPKRADEIVAKFAERVQKYCTVAELKPLKVLQLYRALIQAMPMAHLQFVPVLYQHLVSLLNTELENFKERHISDVLKPPTLPNGFEEEAEKEALAQRAILPALVLSNTKRVYRVPVLVDFVFKVALRSWAAKNFLNVAWQIRLRTAFADHKKAFQGPAHLYPRLRGEALRKFEIGVASKFARELVDICPSALHIPRVQRIFSYADPSVLFKHIPSETANLDEIADEAEKLKKMEAAALLGPFMFPESASSVVVARPVPMRRMMSVRGRGGRGRGARRPGMRAAPLSAAPVISSSPSTIESMGASQMSLIRDVIKKWRRGQSTKSSDNTNFFIPTLCYDMMNRHAAQVVSLGDSIYQAVLNPMRSLAVQKKLVILWSLLPTTNYADIVIFLQQNDSNFQPSADDEPSEEDKPAEVEEAVSAATPAPTAAAAPENAVPKVQLPLAVVETAIRGVTMNDEPLAPLPFLLSPTFLSSSYSRIAVQAVQSLMSYVPGGLLTKALAYLLKDHRKTLKTTAHKQIIRFLAEHTCVEHWDIFISEWENPKTHRDVRITILTAAFQALVVAKDEVLDRVWQVLEMATTYKEADVVCSLLKAQPAVLPRRSLTVSNDMSSVLMNTRTKNQFQSFTVTFIPTECAPRYLEKIIKPLLGLDSGITGSDLQFLAYLSIHQWSGYLNANVPGTADYGKAAELVSQYLLQSLESPALFENDKRRELTVAIARWGRMADIFMQLLTYHGSNSKREEYKAQTSLQEADYIIKGGAKQLAHLVTNLVARAESLASGTAPTPSDLLRYRRYTNTVEALRYLIKESYSLTTVANGNATLEEQETWLSPLRASSFAPLFIEPLTHVQLHQWAPKEENVAGFLKAYEVFVEIGANQPLARSNLLQLLSTWLTNVPTYHGGLTVLRKVLAGLEARLTRWATPAMQSLDISFALDLSSNTVSSSLPSVGSLMDTYIKFLELVIKVNAGLVVHVPGATTSNVISHVTNVLQYFSYHAYSNLSSERKRFMNWLVSRALEVEANYVAKEHPTQIETAHCKLWRQVLSTMRGSYLAQYVPTKVRAVLDAAAAEGSIVNLVAEIISTWLDPSSVIADPALEGHGQPGVDYEFTVNLLQDLVNVHLNAARSLEQNKALPPRYVLNALEAAISAVKSSPYAAILLYKHKPAIWWTLFNEAFVLDLVLPQERSHRLGTAFLNSSVDSAIRVNETGVVIGPLVQLIKDLHECKGALHSLPEIVRNLWPFAPVMQEYRARSQELAIEMLLEHGEGLSLTPPKEKGSTKKIWRKELLALAEEIIPTVPLHIAFQFASSTLMPNSVLYEWPKPEPEPKKDASTAAPSKPRGRGHDKPHAVQDRTGERPAWPQVPQGMDTSG